MSIIQTVISSQNGCLFLRGAYFHGVLINACNILAAVSQVGGF